MTPAEIIREIKTLPPTGQLEVIRFAQQLEETRQLTPQELGQLAQQMVEADDPVEEAALRDAIVRGFYGQDMET